jgi:MoaA/NifB/PqqE/SkfB family radical SAM enzyme
MKTNSTKSSAETRWRHHLQRENWLVTPEGDSRGYIQPHTLRELWFHTGTKCNLGCWFCLEGSGPKANRIETISFEEVRPFVDEAVELGVEQFSFTGGEPFVNHDMVRTLDYALNHRPCLVLTNGTRPLRRKLDELRRLVDKPHPLKFRISLDFPDPKRHDEARGSGSFDMALKSLGDLSRAGFQISVARHQEPGECESEVTEAFARLFLKAGIPADTNIISFPELHKPGDQIDVPYITENCMTTYKDECSRAEFMCAYSKMIVKTGGQVLVYACTLVDDDPDYALGSTLSESRDVRVMLKHHRCYSCFATGATCSER